MKIESKEDKILAEGIDNNILQAVGCAARAKDAISASRHEMEQITLDLPDAIDKMTDEIIEELDALEKKIRKAVRDWAAESLKYEEAIQEFENAREGGRKHAC